MKVLCFHIGADRYGLPLAEVERVLPCATLKEVPLAPSFVAGLLDLHGRPVPVIDLSQLAGHARTQVRFDTRIVLVHYRADGADRPLALMADQVSGIAAFDVAALLEAGVGRAPFLGQVVALPDGLLQLVEVARLLTPEVRAQLYSSEDARA